MKQSATLFVIVLLCTSLELRADQPPDPRATCEARGGTWGQFGLADKWQCKLPTSDAGKRCVDKSDCEGDCIAERSLAPGTSTSGTCSADSLNIGTCQNYVRSGKTTGIICVD